MPTLILFLCAAASHAQTRRALVVGIDQYQTAAAGPPVASSLTRIAVSGQSTRAKWTNLDGAVNDARQMKALLVGRLGFEERNIVLLTNQEATADAILNRLKSHLVDSAAPGDISLFYYAGHGSQIANKLSTEADGLDETLVPADAPRGTPDIRDKELARIYRAAVKKGVLLTVIQDSCHSGSAARGAWNARGKVRQLQRDGRYVEDPPDRDANGQLLRSPEEDGVLVLSASQDYEPASEVSTDSGAHGLFSFALFHALATSPPQERVDRLYQRVRAIMQSEGALQEPVMAGAGRDAKGLLGLPADAHDVLTAAVASIEGKFVTLQGGTASGLYAGCELRGMAGDSPPRLRIERVTGLHSSVAAVIEGEASSVHEGDLFRLDRWVTPEFASVRVFVPAALPIASIEEAVKVARASVASAGMKWVGDPSLEAPGAVMSWQGSAWILEANPAAAAPADLGTAPSAASLASALRSVKARSFFLLVPPPAGLALPFGPGTSHQSVIPATSAAQANYVLYGRVASGNGFEWSWVLPNLTEQDVRQSTPPLAMPLRSDWFPAGPELAGNLAESASAIARVRAWLRLPSPPAADLAFPYRLELRDVASGQAVRSGDIVEGQRFKLWLAAPEPPTGGEVAKRWVYVFAIDRAGTGTLVFPAKGQGNVSNRLPVTGAPLAFPLTADEYDLEVAAPFGVDTFFLLVSAEALPNPEVLDFSGVYQARRGGAENNPLARLLRGVGSGTRGEQPAVPLNWFLERHVFRSVAKKN